MQGTVPGRSAEDKPKLLNQVRNIIRIKRYSIRTEQGYVDWRGLVRSGRKETGLGVVTNAITQIWSRLAQHRECVS